MSLDIKPSREQTSLTRNISPILSSTSSHDCCCFGFATKENFGRHFCHSSRKSGVFASDGDELFLKCAHRGLQAALIGQFELPLFTSFTWMCVRLMPGANQAQQIFTLHETHSGVLFRINPANQTFHTSRISLFVSLRRQHPSHPQWPTLSYSSSSYSACSAGTATARRQAHAK